MSPTLRFALTISSFCILFVAALASSLDLLGIPPNELSYYKSSVIKCKDGSKKFTKDRLNDDFCDCPDGTDEPGTSACPLGKFHCQNLGHIPITIFSSRVNDGLCDCCDGSDEYDGKTKCPNTCWEAGKATREKLKKKIEAHQQGLVIRKQEVDKAKEAYAKDEAELTKLKSEEKILKGLIEKLKEHKERIEKAEEEERIKKENEEKKLKEADKNSTAEEKSSGALSDDTKVVQDVGSSPSDQPVKDLDNSEHPQVHDDTVDEEPVIDQTDRIVEDNTNIGSSTGAEDSSSDHPPEPEKSSDNAEELSREELGRLVASRWTGENAAKSSNEADDGTEAGDKHNGDISDKVEEDNFDGYNSETDDDRYKYDDDFDANEEFGDHEDSHDSVDSDDDFKDEFPESTPSGGLSWLEKIQLSVQNLLQAFNFFKTPVDLSEASRVRKEYDDATSKLSKLQSRISSLDEKLKYDFGNDKEFYSFHGRCFENKQNKYVYKVCPFKSASQVEGHSSTELGRWDKFEESYRTMHFTRGDKCWNGPDRSLKVKLRCGLNNELTDVDEPSRCEYVAILSTPMLCLEEKLKELQKKLEDLNASQPASHDEL